MKGLMIKEFLCLRHQSRSLLLMFGILAAIFLIMFQAGGRGKALGEAAAVLLVAFPVMLTLVLAINSIGYDEQAKWDAYVLSLPVSRDRIVAARYLSVTLLSLAGAALAFLIGLLLPDLRSSPQGLLIMAAAAFACPLLICSVLLPLFFRFGIQKARFAIAAFFLLPMAVTEIAKRAGSAPSVAQQALLCGLAPAFALAAVVLSYLISCAVYRRKEV